MCPVAVMSKQMFIYASNLDFCSGFDLAIQLKARHVVIWNAFISGELRQRTDEGSAGNLPKSEIEIADADPLSVRLRSHNRHLSSSPRKRVRGERETCPLVLPSWKCKLD